MQRVFRTWPCINRDSVCHGSCPWNRILSSIHDYPLEKSTRRALGDLLHHGTIAVRGSLYTERNLVPRERSFFLTTPIKRAEPVGISTMLAHSRGSVQIWKLLYPLYVHPRPKATQMQSMDSRPEKDIDGTTGSTRNYYGTLFV